MQLKAASLLTRKAANDKMTYIIQLYLYIFIYIYIHIAYIGEDSSVSGFFGEHVGIMLVIHSSHWGQLNGGTRFKSTNENGRLSLG